MIAALLAGVCEAQDGIEELVRRANERLGNGNKVGAASLIERALALDPCYGPAVAVAARVDDSRGVELRLRYLEKGKPFDREIARRFLCDLQGDLLDLADETWSALERLSLLPADADEAGCGPPRAGEELAHCEPQSLPHGPLRSEALDPPPHPHRDALRRISERFQQESLADAVLWALLARGQGEIGDGAAARRAFARAEPVTAPDRLQVALAGLHLAPDRHRWWIDRCEPALREAAEQLPSSGGSSLPGFLFREGLVVLSQANDRQGLVRLAELAIRLYPAQAWDVIDSTSTALQDAMFADEALRELEPDTSDLAACMRASLLLHMLQDDRALEVLERLVADHPDSLPGWQSLARASERMGLPSFRERALEQERRLLLREDPGVSSGVERAWVQLQFDLHGYEHAAEVTRGILRSPDLGPELLDSLASFWEWKEGACLAPDFEEALSRTPLRKGTYQRAYLIRNFARLLGGASKGAVVLRAVASLTTKEAEEAGARLRDEIQREKEVAVGRGLLAAAAAQDSFTPSQDRFLRAICRRTDIPEPLPLWWIRLREELANEPPLAGRSGVPYLQSLLMHPWIERDRARELRHAAWGAGCRAPGLIRDLAREDQGFLNDLAAIDPAEARLIRALREEGTPALEAFVEEEDAARPDQVDEAQEEIARRRGDDVAWSPARETRSDVLRAIEEGNEATGVRAGRLLALLRASGEAHAGGIRGALSSLSAHLDVEGPRIAVQHPGPTLRMSLYLPEYIPWQVHAPPTPEVVRVFDALRHGPMLDKGRGLLPVIRALAEAHLTDLRWVALEGESTQRIEGARSAHEAASALMPHRLRNARFLGNEIARDANQERMRKDLDRLCELLAVEPPSMRLATLGSYFWSADACRDVAQEFLQAEAARCKSDEDWVCVTAHAERDPALRAWEELARSDRPAFRSKGVSALRACAAPSTATDLATQSSWPGWRPEDRCQLLQWVAEDALRSGREGDVVGTLRKLWDEALLDPTWAESLVATSFGREDTRSVPPMPGILVRWARGEDAPLVCWYLAAISRSENDRIETLRPEARRRLVASGYLEWWLWLEGLSGQAPEERKSTMTAILDVLPRGEPSWRSRGAIVDIARALFDAGATQEAIGLSQDWAKCVGSVNLGPSVAWGQVGLTRAANLDVPERGVRVHPAVLRAGVLEAVLRRQRATDPEGLLLSELARAEGEAEDATVRQAIRIERASIMCEEKRHTEAVPLLWVLWRGGPSPKARRWALDALTSTLAAQPDLLGRCVELLLDESREVRPSPEDVARARAGLGSASYENRQAETDRLLRLGSDAVPILRDLRSVQDPEVRERVEGVLRGLARPR